ncbi:hypothetical protein HDU76_001601 [Blyttiomyces sp. JEL0837]|nr:hypothetical protein HDU76_001601 [Blyttiomyces sp. JEL0837]
MVLYKVILHTTASAPLTCSHATHQQTGYCPYSHATTLNYTCCAAKITAPLQSEKTTFFNESRKRPKDLSGIILLVMMEFQNETKPNKADMLLMDIKDKLVARSESFSTLGDNQVNSSDSVAIRCLTSSHIRIEMKGKETTVGFITTGSTADETTEPITVDSLEFALWGAGVLENKELKKKFDMFLACVKAEKDSVGKGVVSDIAGLAGLKTEQLSAKPAGKACETSADDDSSEIDGSEFSIDMI